MADTEKIPQRSSVQSDRGGPQTRTERGERPGSGAADRTRWMQGLWVVLAGLGVILVGYVAAVLQGGDAATLFAGLTGVTGTIIGAYFGIQSGQGSKERAETARERAEERTRLLAAAHPRPEVAMRLLGHDPAMLSGNYGSHAPSS